MLTSPDFFSSFLSLSLSLSWLNEGPTRPRMKNAMSKRRRSTCDSFKKGGKRGMLASPAAHQFFFSFRGRFKQEILEKLGCRGWAPPVTSLGSIQRTGRMPKGTKSTKKGAALDFLCALCE